MINVSNYFFIGDLEAQTDGEGQADEEAQTESGIEKFLNHLEVENNDDDDDQVISPSISRNASAKSRENLKVDEKLSNDDDDVISPAISRNASAKSRSEVAIAQDQEPLETDINTETVDENDGDEEEKENNSDQIVQVEIDPVEQEALEDEILNEDEVQGEDDNSDQPDAGSESEKVGKCKSNAPFYLKNNPVTNSSYTQYGPIKNGRIKNQGSDFEKNKEPALRILDLKNRFTF